MSDKEKRLRKTLIQLNIKGQLRPVATIEEASIVLVCCPGDKTRGNFFKKENYQQFLKNGHPPPPPELVYFLVSTNPRNRRQLDRYLLSNKFGSSKHD